MSNTNEGVAPSRKAKAKENEFMGTQSDQSSSAPSAQPQRTWCLILDGQTGLVIVSMLSAVIINKQQALEVLQEGGMTAFVPGDSNVLYNFAAPLGTKFCNEVQWQPADSHQMPVPGERTLLVVEVKDGSYLYYIANTRIPQMNPH